MSRASCPLSSVARWPLVLLAVAAAGPATPVRGQAPAAPGAAATLAAPPTLAAALAAARPPDVGIALAVGAEAVGPPKDGVMPRRGATPAEVADAFGRLDRHFADVSALAPATMTVLNASPGAPNIYDGMPPEDALKLLCGSLTAAQWQALTSDRGLGLSDLATADQRSLFRDLFPGGTLKAQRVVPYEPGKPYTPGDERDLTADLPQARVRLSERTMLMLPVQGNAGMHTGTFLDDPPGAPPRYRLTRDFTSQDTLYGVRVRQEVPNVPKHGQMDLSAAALQVPVPLAGLKTVGDLIGRVRQATGVELYADPHYAKKTLTLVGAAPSAPAGDLLRAVALCLTGTYRQVGPAFVLTDDLIGVGTRRLIWQRFEQEADALRRGPLDAAGDKIVLAGHTARELADPGDGLGITPAQRKAYAQRSPGALDDPGSDGVTLPLSELTPAQQDAARQVQEKLGAMRTPSPGGVENRTTLEGDILVNAQPQLQVVLPGGEVLDMEGLSLWNLFQYSDKLRQARDEERRKQQAAPAPRPAPPGPPSPPPSLAEALHPIPRRAVLADCRTAADVRATLAAMRAVGLNQLWLPVWTGGQDRTALLPAALEATKGTGIAVFAVLDLLRWGRDAPPGVRDLNLLGETSAQLADRQAAQDAQRFPGVVTTPASGAGVLVSPFDPEVGRALRAVLARAAAAPGLAGWIWRETTPAGYTPPEARQAGDDPGALGYTEPARLAFLRAAGADPVDIANTYSRADTRLPEFDDGRLDGDLSKRWRQFRADADLALLRGLRADAAAAGGPPRLLVQAVGSDWAGWYGTWDTPQAPLPVFRQSWDMESGPPADDVTQARRQSRLALVRLVSWPADAGALARQLGYTVKGKPWDGLVLETAGAGAKPGDDPLAKLAASLSPPAPAPAAATATRSPGTPGPARTHSQ